MISNEELIFNKLSEIYPDSLKSITELSYNSSDKRNFIECDAIGFDFDTVNNFNLIDDKENKECSPDGLFLNNDILYFIEFKEGKHNKENIRLKLHESGVTLYFFCKKHLPEISREDFFKLKIRFGLAHRNISKGSGFTVAIEQRQSIHNLRNLEGYIFEKTRVSCLGCSIFTLLKQATGNDNLQISIHSRDGATVENFS